MLERRKRKGESFSDVVIRIAKDKRSKSIIEFAGKWVGEDIDEVGRRIAKDRERIVSRE